MGAGLSKRMGKNKLLIDFKGKPLIEWIIITIKKVKFEEIILVYNDLKVKEIGDRHNIKTVYNEKNYLGQSESIKISLKNISNNHEGYIFFTGDQPLIRRETIESLISGFKKSGGIVIPRIFGVNSSPVVFSSEFKNELLLLEGDEGGRGVIKNNLDKVSFLDFKFKDEFYDIDTMKDLKRLEEKMRDIL